jgi:isopentenyl diphosphate isomerase/L-lactate dehydrogenase-like FMN-dependent dehydrogenase
MRTELPSLGDRALDMLARRRLRGVYNFASAQARARRVLPRVLFDFVDGGAGDEVTLRQNHAAYERISFRPRMAISVPTPDLTTSVLGSQVSMPVLLSPCGGTRLLHPDGERAVTKAAGRFGIATTLSTASGTSLEDVAAVAAGPLWFQLYYPGSRDGAAALVERAQAARYDALFVTVDLPVRGNQERVRSNERVMPPRPTLQTALHFGPQLARRPAWTIRYLCDGMPNGVRVSRFDRTEAVLPPAPKIARQSVTWADIEWLRERWVGPFVVKGVLTADDAVRAVGCGADAVVVSNHGGRQLDGAPATLRVLPEIRDAIGTKIQVLIDGGVRRGGDAVKAIALGADATMIGRPYLYGLAVAGEAGVLHVLELFRDDLIRTLRLLGRESIAEIDASTIELAPHY